MNFNIKMKKQRIILIVEDEPIVKIVEERFSKKGFIVDVARDGVEAIERVHRLKPDLILLDILLPRMNGFKFLEVIRDDPGLNDVPVVIFSNLGNSYDFEKLKEFNVIDYIIKANVTIHELVERVSGYLKNGENKSNIKKC